ncbi:MAG: hypothetical protein V1748_04330 [Actinomycetota bacterium]
MEPTDQAGPGGPVPVQSEPVEAVPSRQSFWTVPLKGRYPRPMTLAGDWLAAVGAVVFLVSVCFLPWISVGVKDVMGIQEMFGIKAPSASYGLFESPWAWVLIGVFAVILCGMYFVQTRGALVLAAGIFCVLFDVMFYIGAWQKINAIIGDVIGIARTIPVIGDALGDMIISLTKQYLSVKVSVGWWLMLPAAVLLILGGSLRLAAEPSRREV